MGEGFGPKCPAGDACETRVFLQEYERVDQIHRRNVMAQNAELRLRVNQLEKELGELRDPEEKREDGKRVRKDRWQSGIRNIAGILFGNSHSFEIDEVVERVRELNEKSKKRRAQPSSGSQPERPSEKK